MCSEWAMPMIWRCSSGRLTGQEHVGAADADYCGQPHRVWRSDAGGSHKAHGAPLGDVEIEGAEGVLPASAQGEVYVPDGVYDIFKNGIAKTGGELRGAWMTLYEQYKSKYPDQAEQMIEIQKRQLPTAGQGRCNLSPDAKGKAGRQSPGKCSTNWPRWCPG